MMFTSVLSLSRTVFNFMLLVQFTSRVTGAGFHYDVVDVRPSDMLNGRFIALFKVCVVCSAGAPLCMYPLVLPAGVWAGEGCGGECGGRFVQICRGASETIPTPGSRSHPHGYA